MPREQISSLLGVWGERSAAAAGDAVELREGQRAILRMNDLAHERTNERHGRPHNLRPPQQRAGRGAAIDFHPSPWALPAHASWESFSTWVREERSAMPLTVAQTRAEWLALWRSMGSPARIREVSDLPCNIRRGEGQSLVLGGPSLVILEGTACYPL